MIPSHNHFQNHNDRYQFQVNGGLAEPPTTQQFQPQQQPFRVPIRNTSPTTTPIPTVTGAGAAINPNTPILNEDLEELRIKYLKLAENFESLTELHSREIEKLNKSLNYWKQTRDNEVREHAYTSTQLVQSQGLNQFLFHSLKDITSMIDHRIEISENDSAEATVDQLKSMLSNLLNNGSTYHFVGSGSSNGNHEQYLHLQQQQELEELNETITDLKKQIVELNVKLRRRDADYDELSLKYESSSSKLFQATKKLQIAERKLALDQQQQTQLEDKLTQKDEQLAALQLKISALNSELINLKKSSSGLTSRHEKSVRELRERIEHLEREVSAQTNQRTSIYENLVNWEVFGSEIVEYMKRYYVGVTYPNPLPLDLLRKEFVKYINALRTDSQMVTIRTSMLHQILDTVWNALNLPQSPLLRNLTSIDPKVFEESKQHLRNLLIATTSIRR